MQVALVGEHLMRRAFGWDPENFPVPFALFGADNSLTCHCAKLQNLFNDYTGSCTKNDGDDGDTGATASNSGGDTLAASGTKSGSSGLSTGAKVGIAIGVLAAVAIIGAALYFLCCQLRR